MPAKKKIIVSLAVLVLLIAGVLILYGYKAGKFKFKAVGPSVVVRNDRLIVNNATILPLGLFGNPADSPIDLPVDLKLPLTSEQILGAGFNILVPVSPVAQSGVKTEESAPDESQLSITGPGSFDTTTASDPEITGLWRFVYIKQKDGLNSECQQSAPLDPSKEQCAIRKAINNNLNRNDVIGWFGIDEPGIVKSGQPEPISPEALVAGYNIAKATDPLKRPIWINQGPRGTAPDSNWSNYDSLLPYNSALDIFSTHIFPVPPKGDMSERYQNKNISMVGEVVDILKQIANKDKKRPFWMHIQGSQKNIWKQTTNKIFDEKPTYQQQRFMAYDALVHGSSGLIWFGTYGLSADDPALKAITDTAKEIRKNRLIFLAAPSTLPVSISATDSVSATALLDAQGKSAIHFMVKGTSDRTYIVATNNSEVSAQVSLIIPSGYNVYRYPTGTRISPQGGAVYTRYSENFEPFGVRVFELILKDSKSTPTTEPTTQ